jgi:uncharacterized membrane protein YbjE (DUF340 family)
MCLLTCRKSVTFSKNGLQKLKRQNLQQQLLKVGRNVEEKIALFDPLTFVYLIVPLVMGILLGYLLRDRKLPKLDKASLAVVVILIFALGFGIGSNNELLSSLPQVGAQGLVIAVLAILFSIAFVKAGKKLVAKQ